MGADDVLQGESFLPSSSPASFFLCLQARHPLWTARMSSLASLCSVHSFSYSADWAHGSRLRCAMALSTSSGAEFGGMDE